ncbi:MAG: sensory histidine-kinase / response regulator, partial [uncultured bacterium]
MTIVKNTIEFIFGSALFINALIFIPQAIRIFREKTAQGVSLLTFAGFLFIQLTIVLHGIINQDYLLAAGYLLSMVTCGLVVFLTLIYKNNPRSSSEIGFREILDQLPGHIYWKNREGVCLGANKNNWSDFGTESLEEFVGKTDYDLFPKHEADRLRMADEEVMRSGESRVFEEESTISGGEKILYLSHKAPLRDKSNQIIGIIGTSVDITSSKRETLDKLKILENIIAFMPGHVYWMDRDGIYLGCNDNQAKSIGLASRQEIIGKRNTEIRGFFIHEVLDPINKEVMETGKTIIAEEPAILHDGTKAIFLSTKAPLYNYNSEIVGMVGISIDITVRKKAEKEADNLKLETALHKTKLREQEKFRKSANQVAHDIRSPLTSLAIIAESCKHIPESDRITLRKIATSIGDIANNLST